MSEPIQGYRVKTTHPVKRTWLHRTLRPDADMGWMRKGTCVGRVTRNWDPWFPESYGESGYPGDAKTRAALFACWKKCPVQRECLNHAFNWPEKEGIWGGTLPNDRLKADSEQHAWERALISMRKRRIPTGEEYVA